MSKIPLPTFAVPGSPGKKRRVFSDVQNIDPRPSQRRKSLGFEMARISHSKDLVPSDAREQLHRGESQIPGPKSVENGPYSQRISRLISIHQNLARKSETPVLDAHATLSLRVTKIEQSLATTVLKQMEEDRALGLRLHKLQEERNSLEEEIVELKREHKRFVNQIGTLRTHIQTLGKKFDFTEEAVMKNVSHKEQLINLQLKDLANQLQKEYSEIQFQLSDELEKARLYKDDDLLREIAELTSRKKDLLAEQDSARARKSEALEAEAATIQSELDLLRLQMEETVNSASTEYKEHQARYNAVSQELEAAQLKVSSKNDDNHKLKEAIRQMEHEIENFSLIASALDTELQEVSSDLTSVSKEEAEWGTKVHHSEAKFKAAALKMEQHNRLRQILENSIMDYESCLRVYVKAPELSKTDGRDTVVFDNRQFAYNKVFRKDTPNFEVIKEFLCLTNSALFLPNVSVVFSGARAVSLMKQSIMSSFESLISKLKNSKSRSNWDFKFALQAIRVSKESTYDLLNSSVTVNISNFCNSLGQILSQKMLVDDTDALGRIIEELPDVDDVVVVLNISASDSVGLKSFESNIMFLSVWNNPLSEQCSILNGTGASSVLNKLTAYAYTRSKCLHLSTLEEYNESLLLQLEKLKATKVQMRL